MLLDDDALRGIEDDLVSAALRPEGWSVAVAKIVENTGARGAAILPLRGYAPGVPFSPSCEALIDAYFREGWALRDHRMRGIGIALRKGILVDQDISTPDFVRKDRYYTDFLGKCGFRWFAGVLVDMGVDIWGLALQRTPDQGPFTPDEEIALRRLIAPLSRAARLAQTVGEARLGGIVDTLQAVRVAGMLLDRTGGVIHVNAKAAPLIGGDLDIVQRRLVVVGNDRATLAIQKHIDAAIWTDLRPDDHALNPVTVERFGRRPLTMQVQPLRKAGLEFFDGARALLTINDPEAAAPLEASHLKNLYGLTAREVEFCNSLLEGRSVVDSADYLGITAATARTHLKRIMAKTNTNRQSALLIVLGKHQPK